MVSYADSMVAVSTCDDVLVCRGKSGTALTDLRGCMCDSCASTLLRSQLGVHFGTLGCTVSDNGMFSMPLFSPSSRHSVEWFTSTATRTTLAPHMSTVIGCPRGHNYR